MYCIIIGARPIGLLIACILKLNDHKIVIYEKREHSTRNHGLNLDSLIISSLLAYLDNYSHPRI